MTQIKNSSLVWSTEDVYANMTEEMRNSREWTEEALLDLGEEFFDTYDEWVCERINEAMSDFMFSKLNPARIGSQSWMREDLKVTHFRNGEPIPLVEDDKEWTELSTAAYCVSPSGDYLYNWYAVNDERGLAPEGWHVPTDEEWTALVTELGGESVAGNKMKSSPSDDPSWNGTNTSGWSALPGGLRGSYSGPFNNGGNNGYWWSASPNGTSSAWYRYLGSGSGLVLRDDLSQRSGFSVRCLRDKI